MVRQPKRNNPPAGSQMGMPVRPEDRLDNTVPRGKKRQTAPTLEKLTTNVPAQTYRSKVQKPQNQADYEKAENERALANRQPGETDDPTTARDGISDAARSTLSKGTGGLY
jgi:hypothetical protein